MNRRKNGDIFLGQGNKSLTLQRFFQMLIL